MSLLALFISVLFQFVGMVYTQGSSPCKIRAVSGVQWSIGFGTQAGMAPTTGNLKTGMMFVDFPGMKATESAKSIHDTVVPGSMEYFSKASYGRLNLNVLGDFTWHTMPKSGSSYGLSRLTSASLEAYVRDAIKVSQNKFSNISVLYIFTTKAASSAFGASAAMPYTVPLQDGTKVRAIAFSGVWAPPGSSNLHMVLPHETGHTMGLPDLYANGPVSQYTGGWDAMGNWLGTSPDFFAWTKWKLGWIDDNQVQCVTSAGKSEHTLTPLSVTGGIKLVSVKLNSTTALNIEYRTRSGVDKETCSEGLLFYLANAAKATLQVPYLVLDPHANKGRGCGPQNGPGANGPLSSAAMDLSKGDRTITFSQYGVKVEVSSGSGSSYKFTVEKK